MCGINGFFVYRESVVDWLAEELHEIRDSMHRRGPDAAGSWLDKGGRVGLGHRRLAIIDLSESGNCPMASHDEAFVITFNGEIYNYRELRDELESEGHPFRTQSDTEVVMAVYERYGAEGITRLRGMFAFAMWDVRRRELILARDPLGIKPLYVSDDGSVLRFASQVKALLRGHGVDTRLEPAGHTGFFLWGHIPEPFTLYKGIRALPAGTIAVYGRSGLIRKTEYFSLADCLQPRGGNWNREELRDALEDTTRAHFVADVPVSLFLSAGRDSSTLLALSSEVRSEPVHAVTLAFDGPDSESNDESILAGEVASLYGAYHHVHQVRAEEFRAWVDDLIVAMDQPSVDGANTYFVSRIAASFGVKVALSGVGADELFGGYASFRQVPRLSNILRWAGLVPWMGRGIRYSVSRFHTGVSPKYAGLLEYGHSIEGAYLLRRALHMPWELKSFLDPDVVKEGLGTLNTMEALRTITAGLPTPHTRMVSLELRRYLQDRLLRDSDWASMANSLELRTPFVDRTLLEWIGPWIAGDRPPTKSDLAQSPKQALPREILSRPKTGFVVPIGQWLQEVSTDVAPEQSWRQWSKLVYDRVVGGDNCRVRVATG